MSLVDRLRAARPDLVLEPSLETRLVELWEAARRPGIDFDAAAFVDHLAPRIPAGPIEAALAELRTADLFLAGALVHGVAGALEAFDRELGAEVERAVRRSGNHATSPDDVRQALHEKLFVALPNARPKIDEYSGRGPLRVWLRVVLTRMVQNLSLRGHGSKEAPVDGALFADLPAGTGDPELDAMRARYRTEFRDAFAAAVASLEVRDRLLLKERFTLEKTQEALATHYGVHVNTVARWIARIRQAVEDRTRAELRRRLHLDEGEFTSILRVVASQLDLSLGKIDPD